MQIVTPHLRRWGTQLPGDKSIAQRALILAALADSPSTLTTDSLGHDAMSLIGCLRQLGVQIDLIDNHPKNNRNIKITINPPRQLQTPQEPLDCGNSGTAARLLMGLLAGYGIPAQLVGDTSLQKRPMARVADPLCDYLGKDAVVLTEQKTLPAQINVTERSFLGSRSSIRKNTPPQPPIPVAVKSAQVKSALLLAGLCLSHPILLEELVPTRDHTERMLKALGALISVDANTHKISLSRNWDTPFWHGFDLDIAGDISAAAFFAALAAATPHALYVQDHVLLTPSRIAFTKILQKMGASIDVKIEEMRLGDPVGTLSVSSQNHASPHTSTCALQGVTILPAEVPALIDELPILLVLGAAAQGTTSVSGAQELRVKESDRIARLADGLTAFGIHCRSSPDGLTVEGLGLAALQQHCAGKTISIRTDGDHRIAMAFTIFGELAQAHVVVDDPAAVAVSFPQFFAALDSCRRVWR